MADNPARNEEGDGIRYISNEATGSTGTTRATSECDTTNECGELTGVKTEVPEWGYIPMAETEDEVAVESSYLTRVKVEEPDLDTDSIDYGELTGVIRGHNEESTTESSDKELNTENDISDEYDGRPTRFEMLTADDLAGPSSGFPSSATTSTPNTTRKKPFSCDYCDYRCTRAGHLKVHMRRHTGEKPFDCDICDYNCSTRSRLKIHMRAHTGEKPFACAFCEYRSRRADHINLHMKTHKGEKPFACNSCDFRCSEPRDLKHHMRTHREEKRSTCDTCDYRCRDGNDMRRHKRTHAGDKVYICDTCDYKCTRVDFVKRHIMKNNTHKFCPSKIDPKTRETRALNEDLH